MLTNFEVEREILNAIALADNDILRLIYADWLEDQGDARSEFVRVQVELSELGKFGDPRLLYPLQKREAELWVHLRSLREHFHGLGVSNFHFRSGILEGITVQGQEFLKHSKTIFRDAPAIIELDLIGGSTLFREISQLSEIQQIRSLRVGGRLEAEHIQQLNKLIVNSNINRLCFSHFWAENSPLLIQEIGPTLISLSIDVSTLSSNSRFTSGLALPLLNSLQINGSKMGSKAMIHLLDSINPNSLLELDIQRGKFSDEVGLLIIQKFHQLQQLAVNEECDPALLDHAPLLKSLESLKLVCSSGTQRHALFKLPFEKLRYLEIKASQAVTEDEFNNLIRADFIPHLYTLHINGGRIPQQRFDRMCDALTQIPGWEIGSKRKFVTDSGARLF